MKPHDKVQDVAHEVAQSVDKGHANPLAKSLLNSQVIEC